MATMDIPDIVVTSISSLIAAGVGAYIGAYQKQKGQNLATREDVEAITRTQKEIETSISDRSWGHQKQWKMKRDAFVRVVRALGDFEDALMKYVVTLKNEKAYGPATGERQEALQTHAADISSARIESDSARHLILLLCSAKATHAIDSVAMLLNVVAISAFQDDFIDLKPETCMSIRLGIEAVVTAAREELGIINDTQCPSQNGPT